MTRRVGIALLALFVLTVGGWTAAFAHEGHKHKVLGTVTMAASDHEMIKDKKAMTVEDIKTGMRVVIAAVTEKEKMVATTIELGAVPATK